MLLLVPASSGSLAEKYKLQRRRKRVHALDDGPVKKGRPAVRSKLRCRVGVKGTKEKAALLLQRARLKGTTQWLVFSTRATA